MNPVASISRVEITTFVNPHLFWFIDVGSEKRVEIIQNLYKTLEELCTKQCLDLNASFESGDIVIAKYGGRLYRAIVEYISEEPNEDLQYLCWLMDYGTMIACNDIYKSSPAVRKIRPLSFQASLNDVVYSVQHLVFNESGGVASSEGHSLYPTPLSRKIAIEVLSEVENVEFCLEEKDEDILYGDILYHDKQGKKQSLRQFLVDRNVLKINEQVFPELKPTITRYKEKHLSLIAGVCKSSTIINRIKTCDDIKQKYIEEFEDAELDEEELLNPRKSKGKIYYNADWTNSDSTEGNDDMQKYQDRHQVKEESMAGLDAQASSASVSNKSSREHLIEMYMAGKQCNLPSTEVSLHGNRMNIENEEESVTVPRNSTTNKSTNQAATQMRENKGKRNVGRNEPLQGKVIYCPSGAEGCYRSGLFSSSTKSYDNKGLNKVNRNAFSKAPSSNYETYCRKQSVKQNTTTHNSVSSSSSGGVKDISSQMDSSESTEEETSLVKISEKITNENTMKIKPYCQCKTCQHWTNDEGWEEPAHFEKEKLKVRLSEDKADHAFLKQDREDDSVEILAIDYKAMNIFEKKKISRILVHSDYVPSPTTEVCNVHFHPVIHKYLEQEQYKLTKRVQSYVWPALFRNQHVFMISGPQGGKTMGYLPVLCTFLLNKQDRYNFLTKIGGAPIIVILCTSTEKCRDVYDRTKLILGKTNARIGIIEYPIEHVNTSNIDLLVTTATMFVDILKRRAINLKRLCHLVLDDGDKLLSYYYDLIEKVLEAIHQMLKSRYHSKSVQLIICGEHWNREMTGLLRKLARTPLVCITNGLEAALYGKMELSIRFMDSACKEQAMKDLLKNVYRYTKSIILCKSHEIEDLETMLMLKGIETKVITPALGVDEVRLLEDNWTKANGGEYTVLITTDQIFNAELSVTSANMLIHYSLPSTWTQFTKRFNCLIECLRSPLDKKELNISCQSVVLVDENCEVQMQKFFKYIDSKELTYLLSDELKQYMEDLRRQAELDKIDLKIELCSILKLFGKCSNSFNCPMRHKIEQSDSKTYLPTHGMVKFKINTIYDVTSYSVELLDEELDEIIDVTEPLSDTLRISKRKPKSLELGHFYAYYADDLTDTYHRCLLTEQHYKIVKIKLMDQGKYVTTMNTRLFVLPKEFSDQKYPRKYVDVYLANLIPPYEDSNFSSKSLNTFSSILEDHNYKDIIFTGYVCLQLANTLWLKEVGQTTALGDGTAITAFNLSGTIVHKKLAVVDTQQMVKLHDQCKCAGIQLPDYETHRLASTIKECHKQALPQWAYLDIEVTEEVIFSCAVSPEEVYVRLNKFNDLLYNLQNEIQQAIKKSRYKKLKEVKPGLICLAKDSRDEEYSRCIVLKVEDEKALCFFVDFGDEAVVAIKELKYISDEFICRLPFQSILCKLQGIKPIYEEWSTDVLDTLYECATEPHTDIFRSLYIKAYYKEKASVSVYQRNKFSVLLKDGFGVKNALINLLLIECGLALPNEEQISDFDISSINVPTDEESEDESTKVAMDIINKTEEVQENYSYTDPTDASYNEDLELFIDDDDLIGFVDEVVNFYKRDSETVFNRELPPIQAAPVSGHLTPELFWYQTTSAVKISIKLTDIADYKLTLAKNRIVNFRANKHMNEYILKLLLFNHVTSMQHTSNGQEIRVTLEKSDSTEWPRLLLSKQKARNIHYDISQIEVREDKKKILQLPKELDIESESDNEIDVMYNVCSDMDSEFDHELSNDSD